jgi:hypothetical protein
MQKNQNSKSAGENESFLDVKIGQVEKKNYRKPHDDDLFNVEIEEEQSMKVETKSENTN